MRDFSRLSEMKRTYHGNNNGMTSILINGEIYYVDFIVGKIISKLE